MAKKNSFDVSTGVDLQEVDNAVNQARKEIATRYDFKGTDCTVEFDRSGGEIKLEADDEYRLTAVLQVVREKLSRRGVPVKNLDQGLVEIGSLGRARQTVGLKQGINQETAKKMVKGGQEPRIQKGPGPDPSRRIEDHEPLQGRAAAGHGAPERGGLGYRAPIR